MIGEPPPVLTSLWENSGLGRVPKGFPIPSNIPTPDHLGSPESDHPGNHRTTSPLLSQPIREGTRLARPVLCHQPSGRNLHQQGAILKECTLRLPGKVIIKVCACHAPGENSKGRSLVPPTPCSLGQCLRVVGPFFLFSSLLYATRALPSPNDTCQPVHHSSLVGPDVHGASLQGSHEDDRTTGRPWRLRGSPTR